MCRRVSRLYSSKAASNLFTGSGGGVRAAPRTKNATPLMRIRYPRIYNANDILRPPELAVRDCKRPSKAASHADNGVLHRTGVTGIDTARATFAKTLPSLDRHIERWPLVDALAFQDVFGRGFARRLRRRTNTRNFCEPRSERVWIEVSPNRYGARPRRTNATPVPNDPTRDAHARLLRRRQRCATHRRTRRDARARRDGRWR